MRETAGYLASNTGDIHRDQSLSRVWAKPALYMMLSVLALLPLAFTTVPPLVDYPNHLARIHILANIAADPALQQNYAVDWSIRPNLGMDLLLPYVAEIVGTYDAGRLFIATTFALLILGTVLLRRTLVGETGYLPILAYLALYNHMLFWGFLNYLFGISIFIFIFCYWIKGREKINTLVILTYLLLSTFLFFIHFFAFCVYGFCLLLFEASRFRRNREADRGVRTRDFAVAFAQFLPAACLTLYWLGSATSGTSEGLGFTYGPLGWKLVALLSPVFWAGRLIDVVIALSLIVIAIWAVRERAVSIVPQLRWPLAGLCLLAPFMPDNITGVEIWAVDCRLPIVIGLLFVASARLSVRPGAGARVVLAAVLALFVWRVADTSVSWLRLDRDFREFRVALQSIPAGSSILLVQDREDLPERLQPLGDRNYWHMVSLGAIERGTFTPTQFTGHMSLRAAPGRASIDTAVGLPLSREQLLQSQHIPNSELSQRYIKTKHMRPYWGEWPKTFDYVLVVRFSNLENPVPEILTPVVRGSFFDVYRIADSSAD